MRGALLGMAGALLLAFSIVSASEAGPPTFGMPNPASRFCAELGGISRAADFEAHGGAQIGLCRLPDDGLIDEWTLFRAARGSRSQAVIAFLTGRWRPLEGPIEGWAEQACNAAGGQVVEYVEHLRPGGIVRLCEFPDRSAIEIWTGFSGPDFYPKLGKALAPAGLSDADFYRCPWPRTCMAPCLSERPPQVVCRQPSGMLDITTFACCCCGSGVNSYFPLEGGPIAAP